MSRWQAIVFDLDDTLYPERDFVLSGFRAVAEWAQIHLGLPAVQTLEELCIFFEQGVRGNTFDLWLTAQNRAEAGLVEQMVEVYREHTPVLNPFPEVPALLNSLRQHYRLGLISDGFLAVQQRKLEALGLEPYFDAVVFSDAWGRAAWKPSPKPFQVILELLEMEAAHVIYLADNPAKDFLGARRTGLSTIWVRRPESEYGHLQPPTADHAPDLAISSLAEVEQALVRLE